MNSHIRKWGNSLGIRIPMQLAKQMHLQAGSTVTLKIKGDQLVIQTPQYDLGTMLQGITQTNQHHQMLDDPQIGNEEW